MAKPVTESTYFERSYRGPYKGIDVSSPETDIAPQASPFSDNVYIRNNELRTFPRLTRKLLAPPLTDLRAIGTFSSYPDTIKPAKATTTFVLGPEGVYKLLPDWRQQPSEQWAHAFNNVGHTDDGFPYPYISMVEQLYFCMGDNKLYRWDGVTAVAVASEYAGARFLGELDAHLIELYTYELLGGVLTTYPYRIRWSASGLPNYLDPTANIGAGFNDMIEVPDEITGWMPVGRVGYIFRTNGITEMYPIGGSFAPWGFNHLWAAQNGIGNAYIGSAASFGSLGIFISQEDIYMLTGSAFNAIGGGATPAIFADLDTAYLVDHSINAAIVPYLSRGAVHPLYILAIPQANEARTATAGMIFWFYSIKERCWFRRVTNSVHQSAAPAVVSFGNPNALLPEEIFQNADNNTAFLMHDTATVPTTKFIGVFDAANNNSVQASSYSYKVEEIAEGKLPTVHRIRIRYRDLGAAIINITLTGVSQPGEHDATQSVTKAVNIGVNGDRKIRTAYADVVFTCEAPQLSWHVSAGNGPVCIIGMTMIGNMGDGKTI